MNRHTKSEMRAHVSLTAPFHGANAGILGWVTFIIPVIGLVVDRHFGMAGQIVTSIACWVLFLWLVSLETPAWRLTLIIAAAFACAAEMFLSLGLGWYAYQFNNIPLFVPPGHVIIFMLGCLLARRMPDWITIVLPVLAGIYGLVAAIGGWGTLDTMFAVIFFFAYAYGSSRKTYAFMIILALSVELWGTWLGNWAWHKDVPGLHLTSTNPPILAGCFYALFDMYVMLSARAIHRWMGDVPAQSSTNERSN
ncbi:hypothetical protein BH11PSE12_BH11PSE12_33970 [soil metagenome]